jgi:hypothetical protein
MNNRAPRIKGEREKIRICWCNAHRKRERWNRRKGSKRKKEAERVTCSSSLCHGKYRGMKKKAGRKRCIL